MKNVVKNLLGTPVTDEHFVSPCGWSERETLTYYMGSEKKIVVERSRRRGKSNVTVSAYVYAPYTDVNYDGWNEVEELVEWRKVYNSIQPINKDADEDAALAQAYGVLLCLTK